VLDTSHAAPQAGALRAAAAPASAPAVTRLLVPLFAATLFLSSFLMFTVEPMVARQMLPVLGGVPMVWNGCVVFFQAILLAGYGGAHVLTHGLGAPARLPVYAALAVVPLAVVRLGVDPASAAHATESPLSWLLVALLTSVGPSFLVLAVSASVLQATFSSTRHEWARDPYFLYASSNAGSLAALIAYPTVVEPWLGLSRQAHVWTIGYGVFVLFLLACAGAARFALAAGAPPHAAASPEPGAPVAVETITWRRRAWWCVLAAVPSSLMLGVTTALTTDIAPAPLLWVAPLALYLATFIFAFGRVHERATALAHRLLPSVLLGLAVAMMLRVQPQLVPALIVHLLPFFLAAMFCHGLLAKNRPPASHLTEFYFWMAFGGMAGGLFNTLAAPMLFSHIVEYPLALAAVAFLRPSDPNRKDASALDWLLPFAAAGMAAFVSYGPRTPGQTPVVIAVLVTLAVLTLARRHRPVTFAAVVSAFLLSSMSVRLAGESVLHAERTFFGTYRVALDAKENRHTLAHGTTLHGMQNIDASRHGEPLSYYHRTGPFGRMFEAIPALRDGDVAAIGLGVGTLAAYASPEQRWTFFEIDPAVERIARDERYFTFLKDCGRRCRVVLGDARLSLAAQPEARYRLIVLDAFSSDAIPMHLMTNDAMAVYLSRLAPGGVLAFHISNRHLRLDGIVGRLAAANGLTALERRDLKIDKGWPKGKTASHWVVMARAPEDLGTLTRDAAWTPLQAAAGAPLWTDDFSDILHVVRLSPR
jgi:hypothetical protein